MFRNVDRGSCESGSIFRKLYQIAKTESGCNTRDDRLIVFEEIEKLGKSSNTTIDIGKIMQRLVEIVHTGLLDLPLRPLIILSIRCSPDILAQPFPIRSHWISDLIDMVMYDVQERS